MERELKKPANPTDVENHQTVKFALKTLWLKKQRARRQHCMAVVAIDAIWKEMRDILSVTPLHQKHSTIKTYEDLFKEYF